jgi:hypothetical protein
MERRGMKTISFNKPRPMDTDAGAMDQWVNNTDTTPESPESVPVKPVSVERIKRLTIDIEAGLHARIKSQCALRGEKMADLIRQLFEREFPAD